MNVHSARARLIGLALYTVTDNRDMCVARRAWSSSTRSEQKVGR